MKKIITVVIALTAACAAASFASAQNTVTVTEGEAVLEQEAAVPETEAALEAEQPEAIEAEPMTAPEPEPEEVVNEEPAAKTAGKFQKYTTLSAGLGAQYYMGENDKYWEDAGLDIVTTNVIDLSFARQKTPVFSWGANLNAAEFIGLYKQTNPNSKFTTDEYIWKHTQGAMYYYRQSGWYARADLFASFNLINICRGYKEKPVFDLDWYIGAGGIVGFGSEDETSSLAPQLTTGLNAKFNITKGFAIKASIRGAAVGDKFDGESRADEPDEVHKKANVPVDGIFGATVGVCFRLGRNK